VHPSRELIDRLVDLLGEENLLLQPCAPPDGRNGSAWRRGGNGRYGGVRGVRPAAAPPQNAPASAAVTRFD
jgi:hypothetical protein